MQKQKRRIKFQAQLEASKDSIATAVYYEDDRCFPSQAAAGTTYIVEKIQREADNVEGNRENQKMVSQQDIYP